jgi:tRNA A-37 threonylcarbamoyl transferase component Bud32
VRELAHGSVANLYAVARDAGDAYLIWQYLPGRTWDEFLASSPSVRERLLAARELLLNVDLLHMQGIVHGALIGSNLILGEDNTWRLTHISPLLYSDPKIDIESMVQLLIDAAGDDMPVLSRKVNDADPANQSLRTLAAKVAAILESNGEAEPDVEVSPRRELRLRSLALAVCVTGVALLFAYAMWRAFATP